jgi:hypothetical protein
MYRGIAMTDNEIYTLLFPIIRDGLAARGVTVPAANIIQGHQPTQQGRPVGPTVYLFGLPATPLGHVKRDSVYDAELGVMRDVETQTYLAVYQANALTEQDPNDTDSLSSLDILKAVRQVLQSTNTIALLNAGGLAILRVNELRNPAFVNDKGRNEYAPSFDFTLTYDEVYTAEAPVVDTFEFNLNHV